MDDRTLQQTQQKKLYLSQVRSCLYLAWCSGTYEERHSNEKRRAKNTLGCWYICTMFLVWGSTFKNCASFCLDGILQKAKQKMPYLTEKMQLYISGWCKYVCTLKTHTIKDTLARLLIHACVVGLRYIMMFVLLKMVPLLLSGWIFYILMMQLYISIWCMQQCVVH